MIRALTVIGFVGALTAAVAAGQTAPEQQLESIRERVLAAHFSEAVTMAEELLTRSDLTAEQRNAALEVLAVAQVANRQRDAANETLRTLYSRDPGHRLTDPDASPPVVSAFAQAREAQPEPVTVTLAHETPTPSRREPPSIQVAVTENADAVAEVRLVYQTGDEGPARVVMTRQADGTYLARIPVVGDASSATDVAYHVVALAPSMTPLAAIGSPAEPLQLRIPPQATDGSAATRGAPPPAEPSGGGSVVEQWWFWTIIGVLVVGGAVTTGILLGPAQQVPEAGTLGTVQLMQLEF